MTRSTLKTIDTVRDAVVRQGEADAAMKSLRADASPEEVRAAYLRCHAADIDVALFRIARGPKTARRVGKLRKDRAKIAEILHELLEHRGRQQLSESK